MNTSFYAFILLIIQQLEWSHAGTAYKFRYLDTYGDDTSMLMKSGFINSDCDGAAYSVDTPLGAPLITSKTVPFSKAIGVECGKGRWLKYNDIEDKNGCDYSSCNDVCKSDTIYKHRCPNFLRERKKDSPGGQKAATDIEPWAFEYKALCKKVTTHPRTTTKTGSLCDYEFVDNDPLISITTATDCSNKFTVKYKGEVIQVSQTVFAPMSKKLVLDTGGKTVTIEVYDTANTEDGTPNIIKLNGKTSPLNISILEVREQPYKVVIKTTGAKHWFYLRPFDVKFTLSRTITNGEAEVKCLVDPDSSYDTTLSGAEVELYAVSIDGDATKLAQDKTNTKAPGEYKCKLKVKTKQVCFPYEQRMTELEVGEKHEIIRPEDLVTTTTIPTTTVATTDAITTSGEVSSSSDAYTETKTQTTKGTTESTERSEATTESTPGSTVPPDFTFKIYLSDEVTNTSEDLTSASKLLVTERCEDIATEKGCNTCKFNVGRLVTGQDPFIPIDVTGFAGRNKRRLTIEGLKKEFNNNLNENSMVKQRKKSSVKVGEDQGRKKSKSKPEEDQTDDDEIIESINNEMTSDSKIPRT